MGGLRCRGSRRRLIAAASIISESVPRRRQDLDRCGRWRLRTTAQVAWEFAHGPIPLGARVVGCPHDPACVRIEHLGLGTGKSKSNATSPATRANRGGGAMSETRPGVWKLTVEGARDEDGHRVSAYRTVDGGRREASKALAAFVVEVGDGSGLPTRSSQGLTVNEVVEWYLAFARDERGLEHSTLVGYSEVYERWLRPRSASCAPLRSRPGRSTRCSGRCVAPDSLVQPHEQRARS